MALRTELKKNDGGSLCDYYVNADGNTIGMLRTTEDGIQAVLGNNRAAWLAPYWLFQSLSEAEAGIADRYARKSSSVEIEQVETGWRVYVQAPGVYRVFRAAFETDAEQIASAWKAELGI